MHYNFTLIYSNLTLSSCYLAVIVSPKMRHKMNDCQCITNIKLILTRDGLDSYRMARTSYVINHSTNH